MDCDRINGKLLIGRYPLDASEVEGLRSLGVTAILSLQTAQEMEGPGIRWERDAALAAKLAFKNIPVQDFDTTDLERKLPRCVASLERLLKTGQTVYVHCRAGVSRSPTVAAAYLHWCLGWPLEQALSHLRNRRDCLPNEEAIHGARWPVPPQQRSESNQTHRQKGKPISTRR